MERYIVRVDALSLIWRCFKTRNQMLRCRDSLRWLHSDHKIIFRAIIIMKIDKIGNCLFNRERGNNLIQADIDSIITLMAQSTMAHWTRPSATECVCVCVGLRACDGGSVDG